MVCYMKKGGVAVADGGTLLLALPFVSLRRNFWRGWFVPYYDSKSRMEWCRADEVIFCWIGRQ